MLRALCPTAPTFICTTFICNTRPSVWRQPCWHFSRALRHDTERRWVLHGCVAVMLAALTAAMYEHNLGDGEVLTLFLTICACGCRAIEGDTVEVKGA
jgi:hypothetical protein